MWKTPFFRFGFAVLLVSTIIFMFNQIKFVFQPLILLIQTIAIPFIIAGVLYYIFLPLLNLLMKKGLNKITAIGIIYSSFLLMVVGVVVFLGPILAKQFKLFVDSIPNFAKEVKNIIEQFLASDFAQKLHLTEKIKVDSIIEGFINKSDDVLLYLGDNVMGILSTATGAVLIAIVVPFVLFYLLKDGDRLPITVVNWFPIKHQEEVGKTLGQMNSTLSMYIQGQILVSVIIGTLLYIGYSIVGLDYALMLAVVATLANIIPFLGPLLGLVFALMVAMMHSFKMFILVAAIVLSIQAIDSNFISPKILGKRLDIHPLVIIFILLFAQNIAGVVGMLIAVPLYALSKVIILNVYRLWKLKNVEKIKKKNPFQD